MKRQALLKQFPGLTDTQLRKAIASLELPVTDDYDYEPAQVERITQSIQAPPLKQRPVHPDQPIYSAPAPTSTGVDVNGIVNRSSSFISNTFAAQTQAMNAELQQAVATDALYVDRASDLLVEMYTTRRARIYATAVQKIQQAQAMEVQTGMGFGEVMSSCFALEAMVEPPTLSLPESV